MGKAIIVFGPSGVGKTTWAASITKPDLTRVLTFEGDQIGVVPAGVEVRNVFDLARYDAWEPETINRTNDVLKKELREAEKLAKTGLLRVLVLDGLNLFHEAAAAYADEVYENPEATMKRSTLTRKITSPLMLSLQRFPCLVILTAHEAGKYDKAIDKNAPVGVQAAIGGGTLRGQLGSYVTDIWHMTQTGALRKFTTQSTGAEIEVKSRLKGPDDRPLLADRNVLVADAAMQLRVYMGWTKAAEGEAGQAGRPKAAVGTVKPNGTSPAPVKPAPAPATKA